MKIFMLGILMMSACAALPSPSEVDPAQETETTISAIQEERAGQNDASTTTGEKGFLDELFEGVADAVTNGALEPLTDVALKPLVSAVGGSLVEQIFSAANEIINEWKRSKHHNLEAHPVFIPDRGSFILVSADWIIPESPMQDNIIEEQELTTTEKVIETKLIKTNDKNEDDKQDDNDLIVKELNCVELSISEQLNISNDNNSNVNNINDKKDYETTTLSILNNETTETLSLNKLDFNVTDDLASESVAELDITNEIQRRSISEHENVKVVNPENEKVHTHTNYRKGRLQRFDNKRTNRYWRRIGTKGTQISRQAKLLNEDMPEVIALKNVYLVPVRGDVDWTRGEEEFEALQEAVKAVMVTRKVTEGRQKMVERLLGDKLRQLANSINS